MKRPTFDHLVGHIRGKATVMRAHTDEPFLHSTRAGARRLHLAGQARAVWRNGDFYRYSGMAKCGTLIYRAAFARVVPDGFELCDDCALHDMTQPAVYRMFDVAGNPLYIGSTTNFLRRLESHARGRASSGWWPLVAEWTFTEFDSIEDARAVERAAIERELPPFNKQHTPWAYRSRSRVGAA